jgi:hypothetical protein
LSGPPPNGSTASVWQATPRRNSTAPAPPSRQLDFYVWYDRTTAITPLAAGTRPGRVPDTFPFGL